MTVVEQYAGGCLCESIRYRFEGPTQFQSYCHCRSCRLATGAPAAAFVGLLTSQYTEVRGARTIFESSPGVFRGFCGECGSSLTFEGTNWPGEIHVYTSTLDSPEGVRADGARLLPAPAAVVRSGRRAAATR